ncbi:hypothetical protein HMPREF3120_05295 [Corynebacterium sp. HMSC11D10]|nr:hypothetical protein HMPREF3120_05295 [Corynebacterium sp. HMSC11D10]
MGASVGIRPKADGENIVLTDTHRDLVDDVTATTDEFGTVLGEGINEIAATAKSANDSAGELASKVSELERKSPTLVTYAPGTASGWTTLKFDGVTYLYLGVGLWHVTVTVAGASGLRLYKRSGNTNAWVAELANTSTVNGKRATSFSGIVQMGEGDRLFLQTLDPSDVEAYLVYFPL